MSAPTKRYLGAVRLSHMTDETTSPERQREQIRLCVQLKDGRLVYTAEDLDVSGSVTVWNRDLEPWLTDPERIGMWDVLIVAKLDRLTRSIVDFGKFLEWCDDHGKTIVSVSEGLDFGTAAGRMFANVLVTFAQFERERMSERRAEASAKLKSLGYWDGGWTKYGFQPIKVDDHYEVIEDPDEKTVAYRMARDVAAGLSATQIARDLTAEGVPTKRGGAWAPETILGILRDPEGILDTDEWTKLQPVIGATGRPKVNRYAALALSGVTLCGKCGGPLWGHHTKRDDTVWQYYRCYSKNTRGAKCDAKMIPTAKLEEAADLAVIEGYGEYPHIEMKLIPGNDGEQQRKGLRRQISALDPEADDYDSKLKILRDELSRIKDLGIVPDRWEQTDSGRTIADFWSTLDDQGKRQYFAKRGWRLMATAGGRGEDPIVTIESASVADDVAELAGDGPGPILTRSTGPRGSRRNGVATPATER